MNTPFIDNIFSFVPAFSGMLLENCCFQLFMLIQIRHFVISLHPQACLTEFQYAILAVFFISIVLLIQSGMNSYITELWQIGLEFITFAFCIQTLPLKIRIFNQKHQPHSILHSFMFFLFIYLISHLLCFELMFLFEWDLFYLLRFVQFITVIYSIYTYFIAQNDTPTPPIDPKPFVETPAPNPPVPLTVPPVQPPPVITNPRFNIDDQYKAAAADIYDVIITLDMPGMPCSVSQIVAEYAATDYVQCMECKKPFGLIECYKDMEWENRNIVLFNPDDAIVYYLSCDVTSEMLDDDKEFNYSAAGYREILCYECGPRWRCGVCDYQAFDWNCDEGLIPGGCYYCKRNICDDCSVYVDSRNVGICEDCCEDESICEVELDDDGIILDILN
eukprot:236354_1